MFMLLFLKMEISMAIKENSMEVCQKIRNKIIF